MPVCMWVTIILWNLDYFEDQKVLIDFSHMKDCILNNFFKLFLS